MLGRLDGLASEKFYWPLAGFQFGDYDVQLVIWLFEGLRFWNFSGDRVLERGLEGPAAGGGRARNIRPRFPHAAIEARAQHHQNSFLESITLSPLPFPRRLRLLRA